MLFGCWKHVVLAVLSDFWVELFVVGIKDLFAFFYRAVNAAGDFRWKGSVGGADVVFSIVR